MPIILAVLAVVYTSGYLTNSAVPGNNPVYPLGWWGWFDQSMYLRATRAFSSFDMDAAKHWYPPGYALLGAPFSRSMPGHAFFFVDLACFGAAFLGFASFAKRFGVGRIWALALFLLPLIDRRLVDAWVVPWSSTPTAALQWGLLALVAAHIMTERFSLWRAVGIGALAGLVIVFRPTDIIAAGVAGACAALFDIIHRRKWLGIVAMVAGGTVVLLCYVALYLRIYGLHLSGYLSIAQKLGFYYDTLGFKAFTLLIDPRAWFGVDRDHWHEGLFQRAPWLIFGLGGMLAAWFMVAPRLRWLLAALVLGIVISTVNYFAFIDLLATGIWRYGNVHYLKWAYPGMALLAFLMLRETVVGRRHVAIAGFVAALLLCCLRIVPRPAADGEPYRMALLAGPRADWVQAYFQLPLLHDDLGPLPTVEAARAFPLDGGIRVLAIQRDLQGPLAWVEGDGLGAITGQRHFKAVVEFGLPCFIFLRFCPGGTMSAIGP